MKTVLFGLMKSSWVVCLMVGLTIPQVKAVEPTPKEMIDSAIIALQKMITEKQISFNTTEAMTTWMSTMTSLASASQALNSNNKVDDAVASLLFTQKLLGSYIAAPGDVFSRGPQLRTDSFDIDVDLRFAAVLKKFPFLAAGTNGRVHVNSSSNIASQYNSIRAEWMAQVGMVLNASNQNISLVRANITWSRQTYVISQPDCIGILGRSPEAFEVCR